MNIQSNNIKKIFLFFLIFVFILTPFLRNSALIFYIFLAIFSFFVYLKIPQYETIKIKNIILLSFCSALIFNKLLYPIANLVEHRSGLFGFGLLTIILYIPLLMVLLSYVIINKIKTNKIKNFILIFLFSLGIFWLVTIGGRFFA